MHQAMNAEENIPPRGFRRNVVIYELVCYVNNIIALYISKNSNSIPVFIERSRYFIEKNSERCQDCKEYIQTVNEYLDIMENHLKSNGVNV